MQFVLGTPVYTADDRHVGSVDRIILSDAKGDVESVVMHKGHFFTRDVIVPMQHVSRVEEDGIYLDLDEERVDTLRDFSEEHYVYPPNSSFLPIGYTMGSVMFPLGVEPGISPMVVEEDKNIGPGASDIGRGYMVACSDGELGVVRNVIVDASQDVISALIVVVANDDMGEVRIPATLIDHVADEVVILRCTLAEFRAGVR
jgi:sporulation protein YlmC with PRC-barrel domain